MSIHEADRSALVQSLRNEWDKTTRALILMQDDAYALGLARGRDEVGHRDLIADLLGIIAADEHRTVGTRGYRWCPECHGRINDLPTLVELPSSNDPIGHKPTCVRHAAMERARKLVEEGR